VLNFEEVLSGPEKEIADGGASAIPENETVRETAKVADTATKPPSQASLKTAREYAALGLPVYSYGVGSNRLDRRPDNRRNLASTNPKSLYNNWEAYKAGTGIATATGKGGAFAVTAHRDFFNQHPTLPPTLSIEKADGQLVVLFKYPQGYRIPSHSNVGGLSVTGSHGFIILPPMVPDAWVGASLAYAPEWLLDKVARGKWGPRGKAAAGTFVPPAETPVPARAEGGTPGTPAAAVTTVTPAETVGAARVEPVTPGTENGADEVQQEEAPRDPGAGPRGESPKVTAEVSAWLDANVEQILPGVWCFGWNMDPPTSWQWPKGKAPTLSAIASGGFMFTTSCRYKEKPMLAPEEDKDPLNFAVRRYGSFHIDFDHADPAMALVDLRRLVFEILPPLGIQPAQVPVFFSGSKGFHASLHPALLGLDQGDRFLPMIYTKLAEKIGGDLPTMDTGIYNMGYGRQFRIPNILRASKGTHKIPLRLDEIREGGLTIEAVRDLSKTPRLDVPLPPVEASPADAPIRSLVKQIRREVWEAMAKPRAERIEMTEEEREAVAAEIRPCIARTLKMETYEGKVSNFDELLASVLVPYAKLVGWDQDEAMDVFGDFLGSFTGSATFDTVEARFGQFEKKWSATGLPWKCSITRSKLPSFSCAGCPAYKPEERQDPGDVFPDDIPPEDEPKAKPSPGKGMFSIMTGAQIMAAEFPNRPLLDGLLDEGESLGLMAANGVGKSLAALDMALALADPEADKLWGRYAKTRPLRTLFCQSEVTAKGLQKRLRAMQAADPRLAPLVNQLAFVSYEGSGRVSGDIESDAIYAAFMTGIERVKPDLLVVDPLVSFHGRDENHADMRKPLDRLTRIQDTVGNGLAILLVHHLGENTHTKSTFKGRGSSAIGDWLANIVTLERHDKLPGKFKLEHHKARNFELGSPLWLSRDTGLRLTPCEDPGARLADGPEQAVSALELLGGRVDKQRELVDKLREIHTELGKSTVEDWIKKAVEGGLILKEKMDGKSFALSLPAQ